MIYGDDLQEKELKLLYEIATLLADTYALKETVKEALKRLKSYLGLANCTVYMLDEEAKRLEIFSSVDLTQQQKTMGSYALGEGATGLAAQTKEPVVIENIHNDIVFLNKTGSRNKEMISYVAVPMLARDKVLGVLGANLMKHSAISFDESVRILTIVSSLFAQAKLVYQKIKSTQERLCDENNYYKMEILQEAKFENIIGKSTQMQQVFDIIQKVANSNATVLVRGETGTGKELIASALHNLSERKHAPFIKLNCAAISETLLESELFGHEKGAFTDAKELRKGRFELAHKGTLFLDEIGDISAALQVKLLRILQEQEFERVGGAKTVKVDVRLVAATNRNLEEMVELGEFREDLFYRLNVIPINLPPLRQREKDVNLLINFFFEKYCKIHKKKLFIEPDARCLLKEYSWPGNIRELENTMERLVLLADTSAIDERLTKAMLPSLCIENEQITIRQQEELGSELHDIERNAIIKALEECHGVQVRAAQKLGLSARQIGYKIKKYNIVY